MWDLWWTKWHWHGFSPSTSVFPYQFHSTGAPLHGKMKKLITFIFIFITGLYKMLLYGGCTLKKTFFLSFFLSLTSSTYSL
jgi:hypothetical protein